MEGHWDRADRFVGNAIVFCPIGPAPDVIDLIATMGTVREVHGKAKGEK